MIERDDRIATAGSCFAQHISRNLSQIGFNYYVPESGVELPEGERQSRNFGVFSARYGNIYTARQLLQVFDEAFGEMTRNDRSWIRSDGRFVDPYRPQIEPEGFENPEAVMAARAEHLRFVRTVFENSKVFIFTLGLTESWMSRADGSVFPIAPGVVAGSFDDANYLFVNFNVAEVEQDLRKFLHKVKIINPHMKVLLTVSPVPLIATYEERNVLVSTTYSKSVLRVAAETIWREFDWVDYFPSYEIITGSYNYGAYYGEDAREVNQHGVAHAMRSFTNNYVLGTRLHLMESADAARPTVARSRGSGIVCDEEAIAAIKF